MKEHFQESRWRRRSLWPILGIYFILAFYGIERQSLWEDEFLSLERTASAIPIWKDGHGFLYFALLSYWINLGTSEVVLRSLSVLFGALAVVLVHALGMRLLNPRAAVFGTLIFATSPFMIWYSQEARYITLMMAATLAAMFAYEQAVVERGVRWWIASAGAMLLAFFSFISTLLLPVVQALNLGLSSLRRPLLMKWTLCQIFVFAVFALWFVQGTHFLRAMVEAKGSGEPIVANPKVFPFSADYNVVTPAVIPYTFFALSAGFSLGPSPRELYADRSLDPLLAHAPMLLLLSVLYAGLLLAGLFALRRQNAGMLLALWVAVPVLGLFAIAKLLDIFYDVRYAAYAFPAYALLLGAGIASCRKTWLQMGLLAAVLAVHSAALANYYFDPRYAREDTRAAALYLESSAGARDAILIVGTLSSLPHYYRGDGALVDVRSLGNEGLPPAKKLRDFSSNHERLWLVQIRPWQIDRTGEVKAALDEAFALVAQQRFPGVDVFAYRISK